MMTLDKYGLPIQEQQDGSLDGGDTICWEGHRVYLSGFAPMPLVEFQKGFGYVRHFDSELSNNGFAAYYKHPWDGVISRDQITGIIGWIIATKDYKAAIKLMIHHGCWLFLFTYNTRDNGKDPAKTKWKWPDLTLFETWAIELRMFGPWSWIFWPLLNILDIHLFFRTILFNRQGDSDPISFAMRLVISIEHVPTITSLLTSLIIDGNLLIGYLNEYFCGWRKQELIAMLWNKKIKELALD